MNFFLTRLHNAMFIPSHDSDFEKAVKVPIDSMVKCEFIKTRNYGFHKKFFALIRFTFHHKSDSFKWIMTEEHLREILTLTAGYYELRQNFDSSFYKVPKSIAFDRMDQDEFEKFYSDVLDVVLKTFEFDQSLIENEIINFL